MELVNAIPSNWKINLKHSNNYSQNLLDHLLLKSNFLFYIEKLESTKFYCIINSSRKNKPTSQIYFEKKFHWKELDWRVIYALPRNVITNTYQYNNIRYYKQCYLSEWKTFCLWTFYNIISVLLQFFW